MELFSISIRGFRRFSQKTMLRTNGKALALVGPNEAGKSSVLEAIHSLRDTTGFGPADVSRGMQKEDLEIVGRFLLNDADLSAAGLTGPGWLRVHKEYSGRLTYGVDPIPSSRDTSHRGPVIDALRQLVASDAFRAQAEEIATGLLARLEDAAVALAIDTPDLERPLLDEIRSLKPELEAIAERLGGPEYAVNAARLWAEMLDAEAAPAPLQRAINALHDRVPTILFFDEASRELASTYAVAQLRGAVPQALQSLMTLAKLDPNEIFLAIDAGDTGKLTTLEYRANAMLERSFGEAWRQSGIKVALRLSPAQLDIQIVNERSDFTPLAERSDGLRQFVALHSFISINRADHPILLIDEAEQRLHYDAQADLVQMLTRQRVASKVIYTTHSAGCLPEDLGNGVRLVQPCADDITRSAIINKFWADGGAGFSPLLFGMGATTLAFFPTRHAVCVEGPGDMLLYPTMFREILGVDGLGFQVVPNLSSAARGLMPLLKEAAAGIAFLVDGDEGGRAISQNLLESGIDASRVIVLQTEDGEPLEIEDFVEPGLLLKAANSLIKRHHAGVQPMSAEAIPDKERMASLERAYRAATGVAMPKVELAYELLDIRDADPNLVLVAPGLRDLLVSVAKRVAAAVGA